ncbi:hypothetical protein F5Y19DRAFT_487304 [Xylariaceae sp. FL1651]|nr:hypothetical protein F5Y19DRAFT_487304 [Xylariaceae sp. FL1651]
MKFLVATFTAALAGLTLAADPADPAATMTPCPTITKQALNPTCDKTCANDCRIVSTIANPCGCPRQVPTATLLSPCNAECPYGGCDVRYRTSAEECPTRTTRWPPPPPTSTPSSTSSSTSTPFIITVTTLPGKPTVTPTPCPTVTFTTRPSDCDPIRCPIPDCTFERDLVVPCGCDIKTLLSVDGCQTACPTGCATRTTTLSQLCVTATPVPAHPLE